MSLFAATLLTGIALAILGVLFAISTPTIVSTFKGFPRSKVASSVFFGGAAAWFLWIVAHLGEADFGEYKTYLFIGFSLVAILSFYYVPDFLAVRGASILILLAAHPLLQSAFMKYDIPARLFLVTFLYLLIVLALFFGVVPYRLRDFFQWLFSSLARARKLGVAMAFYGLLLVGVALTY